MATFAFASIVARLPRFLIVAAVSGLVGPMLRRRFGNTAIWIVFALAWAVFYAVYLTAMAG